MSNFTVSAVAYRFISNILIVLKIYLKYMINLTITCKHYCRKVSLSETWSNRHLLESWKK